MLCTFRFFNFITFLVIYLSFSLLVIAKSNSHLSKILNCTKNLNIVFKFFLSLVATFLLVFSYKKINQHEGTKLIYLPKTALYFCFLIKRLQLKLLLRVNESVES